MTRSDTAKIMAILSAAYPGFYSKQTKDEKVSAVDLWADLFADDDPGVVLAAVKAHIATDTKGFPPVIGQIKEQITKLTQPKMMTEAEAWGLVWRAVCNSGYHAQSEYDALPPLLQRLVGSPSQLHDWALMDADEVQSVVASNFMRSYRVRAKDWQEYQALPGAIRERLDALADGMRMPEERMLPGDVVKRLEAGT
jgi:hypothetical protein